MNELKEALLFMRMQELRDTCKKLNLPFTGLKGVLVKRIVHFLETGEILSEPKMPEASKSKKGTSYPLHPDTLILYGSYKNDYATRDFMKTLIGNHFHFTAAGIDWIKERWADSNPPAYQEFATFWQQQYQARKHKKPAPKEEWAFIKFTQTYLAEKPAATHGEIIQAWKQEQRQQVKKAQQLIGSKFDDFLEEEGLLEEAESVAAKRVFVYQVEQEQRNNS